jgi:hypothetical protein
MTTPDDDKPKKRHHKLPYSDEKIQITVDAVVASRQPRPTEEEVQTRHDEIARAYSILASWLTTKTREFGCGQLIELILEHCGPRDPNRKTAPTIVDPPLPLIDQLASLIEARGVLKTLPYPLKLPFGTYRVTKAQSAARIGMMIIIQFIFSYIKNATPTDDACTTDTIQASAPKIIASLFDLTRDVRSQEIVEKTVEVIRGTTGSPDTPATSE